MNNQQDSICTSAPYNTALFPSVTSKADFDVLTYAAQISALEDALGNIASTLYTPAYPSVEEIKNAEKNIMQHFGDSRFTGIDIYNSLHTRYRHLDTSDIVNEQGVNQNNSIITLTACDFDGYPYTYTTVNSSYFLDTDNSAITLPVYDKYGRKVTFPLYTENKHILITSALSAYDATNTIVYFPLKDSKNLNIKYPFKDLSNKTLVTLPEKNSELLLDPATAHAYLDLAYSNAKDADAFNFVTYLLTLLNTSKISFYYSRVNPAEENTAYFAAAVYDSSASDLDLKDLLSTKLKYFIRYYADRADFVCTTMQEYGASCILNVISDTTSTATSDKITSEKIKIASYSILSAPYWSSSKEESVWKSTQINDSTVHTSVLELYTNTGTNAVCAASLQSQIIALSAAIDTINTSIASILIRLTTLETSNTYNSGVIDTLATPINWPVIWQSPIPSTFVAPTAPAGRT